ncbi:MAG TPA: proteasome-type protease [Gammaproteobacteria bacterium]|nr:proteasome-type protease [Gammaproteobacteria bacterium]
MTYCLAIALESGIVFVSDSRTNAGVDNVSTYSKMYGFGVPGERQFIILSSGNLATSQGVVAQVKRDIKQENAVNLMNCEHLSEAAEYIGGLNRAQQEKNTGGGANFEASFVVGGQIIDHKPAIYMVYPQGNFITTSHDTPYLQIGESKYGKPILDRIIRPNSSLETAAMCALVSMDSTMRSNLTVGPPIELNIYQKDSLQPGRYYRFDEDSEYLRQLKRSWDKLLKEAFKKLPPVAWSSNWDNNAVVQDDEQSGSVS